MNSVTRVFFRLWIATWLATALTACGQSSPYYPGAGGDWERRAPEEVGMDSGALEEAIAFSIANETPSSRDLSETLLESNEPFNELIGPTKERGDVTGLIVRHGYIVAEWGDIDRVDMTFSVTKSFLSSVAGLAWDRGLIRDLNDPIKEYVPTDHYDSEHNSPITWDHMLRQTSEWEGALWGIEDWEDRPESDDPDAWRRRELKEPGGKWKYNDVRVNLRQLQDNNDGNQICNGRIRRLHRNQRDISVRRPARSADSRA